MARLEKWAEQAIRVVDEGGGGTSRIRLLTEDGSTWQTWEAPFSSVGDWCAEAEALLSELQDDFAGDTPVLFVAENSSGTVRSQCPRRVIGRQKKNGPAGAFTGGGSGGAAASLQAMYDAQARTTEKILQSANVQLEVLTRTVETQGRAHGETLEYIRAMRENDALKKVEETNQTQEILGQLMEQAPLLFELLKQKKNKGSPVASAAVEAVKEAVVESVTNGVGSAARNLLTPES